jgi:hypothetical protein
MRALVHLQSALIEPVAHRTGHVVTTLLAFFVNELAAVVLVVAVVVIGRVGVGRPHEELFEAGEPGGESSETGGETDSGMDRSEPGEWGAQQVAGLTREGGRRGG